MTVSKIVLKNFESHEHTVLDLSPKITAITGRTDSGKSSIFRAIYWLVNNEPRGEEFIRRGCNFCCVELHLEDGKIIGRKKGKEGKDSVNQYYVIAPGEKPVVYDSVGNSVPEELWVLLGMNTFLLPGENKPTLNFAEQGSPPFGVYDSGPERARKLSAFSGIDKADSAIKLLTNDIRALRRSIATTEESLSDLRSSLQKLKVLDSLEAAVKKARVLYDQADEARLSVEHLKEIKNRLSYLNEKCEQAQNILRNIRELEVHSPNLETAFKALNSLEELNSFKNLIENINHKTAYLERLSKTFSQVDFMCEKMEEARKKITAIEELKTYKERVKTLSGNVAGAKEKIQKIEKESEELEKTYHAKLKSLEVCPLCNQTITNA